jgi:hypothetical protein
VRWTPEETKRLLDLIAAGKSWTADQRHAQAQYEVRQTSREDASTGWRKKERLPAELRAKVKK